MQRTVLGGAAPVGRCAGRRSARPIPTPRRGAARAGHRGPRGAADARPDRRATPPRTAAARARLPLHAAVAPPLPHPRRAAQAGSPSPAPPRVAVGRRPSAGAWRPWRGVSPSAAADSRRRRCRGHRRRLWGRHHHRYCARERGRGGGGAGDGVGPPPPPPRVWVGARAWVLGTKGVPAAGDVAGGATAQAAAAAEGSVMPAGAAMGGVHARSGVPIKFCLAHGWVVWWVAPGSRC